MSRSYIGYFIKGLRTTVIIIGSIVVLSGCIAPVQNNILPDKYARVAAIDGYKSCVATATNSYFDETTNPDAIVRRSLTFCNHFKYSMFKEYPASWREKYIKDIDAELYTRETNWIKEARNNKNPFFR